MQHENYKNQIQTIAQQRLERPETDVPRVHSFLQQFVKITDVKKLDSWSAPNLQHMRDMANQLVKGRLRRQPAEEIIEINSEDDDDVEVVSETEVLGFDPVSPTTLDKMSQIELEIEKKKLKEDGSETAAKLNFLSTNIGVLDSNNVDATSGSSAHAESPKANGTYDVREPSKCSQSNQPITKGPEEILDMVNKVADFSDNFNIEKIQKALNINETTADIQKPHSAPTLPSKKPPIKNISDIVFDEQAIQMLKKKARALKVAESDSASSSISNDIRSTHTSTTMAKQNNFSSTVQFGSKNTFQANTTYENRGPSTTSTPMSNCVRKLPPTVTVKKKTNYNYHMEEFSRIKDNTMHNPPIEHFLCENSTEPKASPHIYVISDDDSDTTVDIPMNMFIKRKPNSESQRENQLRTSASKSVPNTSAASETEIVGSTVLDLVKNQMFSPEEMVKIKRAIDDQLLKNDIESDCKTTSTSPKKPSIKDSKSHSRHRSRSTTRKSDKTTPVHSKQRKLMENIQKSNSSFTKKKSTSSCSHPPNKRNENRTSSTKYDSKKSDESATIKQDKQSSHTNADREIAPNKSTAVQPAKIVKRRKSTIEKYTPDEDQEMVEKVATKALESVSKDRTDVVGRKRNSTESSSSVSEKKRRIEKQTESRPKDENRQEMNQHRSNNGAKEDVNVVKSQVNCNKTLPKSPVHSNSACKVTEKASKPNLFQTNAHQSIQYIKLGETSLVHKKPETTEKRKIKCSKISNGTSGIEEIKQCESKDVAEAVFKDADLRLNDEILLIPIDSPKTSDQLPVDACDKAAENEADQVVKLVPKNINKSLYFKSVESLNCVICSKQTRYIVSHYLKYHKESEVYVSRLSAKMATEIRRPKPTMIDEKYKISAFCHFCESRRSATNQYWGCHLTAHTGEYMFYCELCDKKISTRSNHTVCGSAVKVLFEYDVNKGDLTAYLCKVCNYVQIHQDRIVSHLKSQHEFTGSLSKFYEQVVLLPSKNQQSLVNGQPVKFESTEHDDDDKILLQDVDRVENLNATTEFSQSFLNRLASEPVEQEIEISILNDTQPDINISTHSHEQSQEIENSVPYENQHNVHVSATGGELQTFVEAQEMETTILKETQLNVNISAITGEEIQSQVEPSHEALDTLPSMPTLYSESDDQETVGEKSHPDLNISAPTGDNLQSNVHSKDKTSINRLSSSQPLQSNATTTPYIVQPKIKFELNFAHLETTITHIPMFNCNDQMKQEPVDSTAAKNGRLGPKRELLLEMANSFMGPLSVGRSTSNVKPWLGIELSDKRKTREITLYARYKCMDAKCLFSTNNENAMRTHFQNHKDFIWLMEEEGKINSDAQKTAMINKCLECCYCELRAHDIAALIGHIKDDHECSKLQCKYCFYRTVEVDNIDLHYDKHHQGQPKQVLLCDGECELTEEKIAIMLENRKENVFPFNCGGDHCENKEFFIFDHFEAHLKTKHANTDYKCHDCKDLISAEFIERHLQFHGYAEFQCIYCKYGRSDIKCLKKHMSENHPSEFLYVSARRYQQGQSYSMDTQDIESTAIVNIADPTQNSEIKLIQCSYTDDELNFMDAELTSQDENTLTPGKFNPDNVKDHLHKKIAGSHNFFVSYADYKNTYATTSKALYVGQSKNRCEIFKCELCDYSHSLEHDMMKHFKEKHPCEKTSLKHIVRSSNSVASKRISYSYRCTLCEIDSFDFPKAATRHFKHQHEYHTVDIVVDKTIEEKTQPKGLVDDDRESIESTKWYLRQSFICQNKMCLDSNHSESTKARLIKHHSEMHSQDHLEYRRSSTILSPHTNVKHPSELKAENIAFDRSIVYTCPYCNGKNNIYNTANEVYTHWFSAHSSKQFRFSVKGLIACYHCRHISTFEGIKAHHRERCEHSAKRFATVNELNNLHCGKCDKVFDTKSKVLEHYEYAHDNDDRTIEPNAFITNEFLDKLLQQNPRKSPTTPKPEFLYLPGCCSRSRFTDEKNVVLHVNSCQREFLCMLCPTIRFKKIRDAVCHDVEAHGLIDTIDERCNLKKFLALFRDMQIVFSNGLMLTKDNLSHTKYGGMQQICQEIGKIFASEKKEICQSTEI